MDGNCPGGSFAAAAFQGDNHVFRGGNYVYKGGNRPGSSRLDKSLIFHVLLAIHSLYYRYCKVPIVCCVKPPQMTSICWH